LIIENSSEIVFEGLKCWRNRAKALMWAERAYRRGRRREGALCVGYFCAGASLMSYLSTHLWPGVFLGLAAGAFLVLGYQVGVGHE